MRFVILLCCLLGYSSCSDISFQGEANDVPTAGSISIGFEPGDSFLVTQWLEVFHSQYPKAHIKPVFMEKEMLKSWLVQDSLQGIFMHDTFSQEEINWLSQKKNATVNAIPIGFTAPVWIASPKVSFKEISLAKSDFNNLGINRLIVRDKWSSEEQAAIKYLKKIIGKDSNEWKRNAYVQLRREKLPRDIDIIEYVEQHTDAIGLISLNTIADKRDSLSVALQRKVRILAVENDFGAFHLPFQSQIAAKQYPVVQPIWSYETQGYSGLIKGFVIYANSQSGQALVQKSGLKAANYQGRKIQIDLN